ncbi:MAG TPA: DUF4430 domain-containing protein [Solirubrobacterales bacterium]
MRRWSAIAIALLVLSALATAGCGLGPGHDLGRVGLTVTRDYGAEQVVPPVGDEVNESDTVMRVLERDADITTRYGGGFVQSIDGLEGEYGGGRSLDWFFYVDGVESTVGAADFQLRGGEAIWWDYRDWSAALSVPAVVGSYPHPFAGGYEGREHPTSVECRGAGAACATVEARLRDAGATLGSAAEASPIRVLVGPWARLRSDPAAAQLEDGPGSSGVFARFEQSAGGEALVGLDESGDPGRRFGAASGLVAATRRGGGPPTWIVTGVGAGGVEAAARLLDPAALRDHYAVATEGGARTTPLPLGS